MQLKSHRSGQRSQCPINAAVEVLGDQWSLLILRDILLEGRVRFSEFRSADEGVATNILAARLKHLVAHGLIEKHKDPQDGRGALYLPTERALDTVGVLLAMIAWSDQHRSGTQKFPDLMARYQADPSATVTHIKARAAKFRDAINPKQPTDLRTSDEPDT